MSGWYSCCFSGASSTSPTIPGAAARETSSSPLYQSEKPNLGSRQRNGNRIIDSFANPTKMSYIQQYTLNRESASDPYQLDRDSMAAYDEDNKDHRGHKEGDGVDDEYGLPNIPKFRHSSLNQWDGLASPKTGKSNVSNKTSFGLFAKRTESMQSKRSKINSAITDDWTRDSTDYRNHKSPCLLSDEAADSYRDYIKNSAAAVSGKGFRVSNGSGNNKGGRKNRDSSNNDDGDNIGGWNKRLTKVEMDEVMSEWNKARKSVHLRNTQLYSNFSLSNQSRTPPLSSTPSNDKDDNASCSEGVKRHRSKRGGYQPPPAPPMPPQPAVLKAKAVRSLSNERSGGNASDYTEDNDSDGSRDRSPSPSSQQKQPVNMPRMVSLTAVANISNHDSRKNSRAESLVAESIKLNGTNKKLSLAESVKSAALEGGEDRLSQLISPSSVGLVPSAINTPITTETPTTNMSLSSAQRADSMISSAQPNTGLASSAFGFGPKIDSANQSSSVGEGYVVPPMPDRPQTLNPSKAKNISLESSTSRFTYSGSTHTNPSTVTADGSESKSSRRQGRLPGTRPNDNGSKDSEESSGPKPEITLRRKDSAASNLTACSTDGYEYGKESLNICGNDSAETLNDEESLKSMKRQAMIGGSNKDSGNQLPVSPFGDSSSSNNTSKESGSDSDEDSSVPLDKLQQTKQGNHHYSMPAAKAKANLKGSRQQKIVSLSNPRHQVRLAGSTVFATSPLVKCSTLSDSDDPISPNSIKSNELLSDSGSASSPSPATSPSLVLSPPPKDLLAANSDTKNIRKANNRKSTYQPISMTLNLNQNGGAGIQRPFTNSGLANIQQQQQHQQKTTDKHNKNSLPPLPVTSAANIVNSGRADQNNPRSNNRKNRFGIQMSTAAKNGGDNNEEDVDSVKKNRRLTTAILTNATNSSKKKGVNKKNLRRDSTIIGLPQQQQQHQQQYRHVSAMP
ncbi:hypothetical protein H4219_004876 [Mycoemilia scoparia]|uniref:Uncharacterized protein n=1 Tax=Mycoemilia scoparia TaxID=417184 RepID=A0A9W8DR49_9FUNG|nr:hypothetical protein H4219_004876 [Mycoemilia scoparia]